MAGAAAGASTGGRAGGRGGVADVKIEYSKGVTIKP